MKASRHVHELHEGAEEELTALRRTQAGLSDRLQATELEMEELRRHRAPTEAQWREEAGAWQGAYDAAKASAGRVQQQYIARERDVVALDTQVREARKSLNELEWDLEDARAAYGATQDRVLGDTRRLEEEVVQARARSAAQRVAAEAERSESAAAERLAGASEAHVQSAVLDADAAEHRCMQLETELSDWHQRVAAGRAALGRLRELHQEARLRLDAASTTNETAVAETVDRACSPAAGSRESVAEMELRTRLHKWETQLRALEGENQQLRRMKQLDTERLAAKTERLRLKAERYRNGHADLRRLYFEQQENRQG